MYLYLITNLINDKKYIGITNNYKKRWANHKCNNSPTMAIAKAIKKYGAENFKFEVLLENIPIEEINQYEQEYIKKYHTHVSEGKGYNIAWGGMYSIDENSIHFGEDNGRALLTNEEAQYIKDHRNIPMYVLYDDFAEKINYDTFKQVYKNQTYPNVIPHVEEYPFNLEFSNQFTSNNKLDYADIVSLREQYNNHVPWKQAFIPYKDIFKDEMSFWNIYNGNKYKLVMPEVFTEANKHFHSGLSHSGEDNGRAKLTSEEVKQMRYDFEHNIKTRKQIQTDFAGRVSSTSINNILRYTTWKNI